MALSTLKTPGVYVQEISTLPPSIAPVSTAVPAFFGYTEKGTANTPVRITSLLDYEATFGGPYSELYKVDIAANGTLSLNTSTAISPYVLYYHLQMYFGNGGGPCHIVSVGTYDHTAAPSIVAADFYVPGDSTIGIPVAEQVDEVTLLVAPEIAKLTNSGQIRSVYDAMLAQCEKLKDRFCIFDVQSTGAPTTDASMFRNSQVSANFLKYGAAYYPNLDTILTRSYEAGSVIITDNRTPAVFTPEPNNTLATIKEGKGSFVPVAISAPAGVGKSITFEQGAVSVTFTEGVDFELADLNAKLIVDLVNNHPTLSTVLRAQLSASTPATEFYVVTRFGTADTSTTTIEVTQTAGGYFTISPTDDGVANSQDTSMYTSITDLLNSQVLVLSPSATMAGIYSSVDNSRGVWKAPANVSVANIVGPSFQITEAQQGDLNVDATSGKSINAIRSFVGRGTLVWGARTLDGNSNEWRYVPVRRLFTFVEESTKKATEFVVFEPNDMNTWLRVKGTISNFLSDLWKQGALAGAKPEDAFFVRVGLGETMTAQDILEGKMIVSIGMAAVRPAEFIVLQFMHKLQEA
jgi:uncharacterized protein